MNRTWTFLLVLAAFALLPWYSRADGPLLTNSVPAAGDTNSVATGDTNAIAAVEDTNAPPLLKDLMASNNIVTNSVGIVLVKVSKDLWAGKYEVTQQAYRKVMGDNPSAFSDGQRPVDSVSWNDAAAFCEKLTQAEEKSGDLPKGARYTLPTETEWETLVADASLKDAVMKFTADCSSTSPVGSLGANSLGLHDTRGNVMEWCLDSHDPAYHVLRGGAWDTYLEPNSRIEFRNYAGADDRKDDYGFRVVVTGVTAKP